MAAVLECCDRMWCGGWCTHWGASEEMRQFYPPRHSDFRDSAPQPMQKVYDLYEPVVRQGRWTAGLLEMWFFKHKPVKHSVHIPCWDSFKWNPLKWRGICLGRTGKECFWTGTRQMRWARAVYAANLGREYVMPVRDIGRHGYKSDIKALCMMYCLMGTIFSCGIGQLATVCGSCLFINFGACFSCHARERLRRRYQLPSSFGLPPGIDDFLVHFFCFYCASHQEVRELAMRGVDGPGMHILDLLPDSYAGVEGIEEAKAERRAVLQGMLARPPKMFRARGREKVRRQETRLHKLAAAMAGQTAEAEDDMPMALDRDSTSAASSEASSTSALGWCRYCPPTHQEMARGGEESGPLSLWGGSGAVPALQQPLSLQQPGSLQRHSVHSIPVIQEQPPGEGEGGGGGLQKAWSVAY